MADAADLIVRFLDRGAPPLDDAERDELNDLLRRDASARDLLADLSYHARALRESMNPQQNAGLGTRNAERAEPGSRIVPSSAFRVPRSIFPLAAALLLAAAAVAIYLVAFNSKPETRNPKPAVSALVATVVESTGNFIANDTLVAPGDDIRSGDLSLDAGSADFRLINGVSVCLRGDTRLAIHTPMSATLTSGSATFDCPPAAKGYTVHLPGGTRVVDLGTVFTVHAAADGTARVRVDQGGVRIVTIDRERSLAAGEQAWISRDGDPRSGSGRVELSEALPIRGYELSSQGPVNSDYYRDRDERGVQKLINGRRTAGAHPAARPRDEAVAWSATDGAVITFDFQKPGFVDGVRIGYLVHGEWAVVPPVAITVACSDDGVTFDEPVRIEPADRDDGTHEAHAILTTPRVVRRVRLHLVPVGVAPSTQSKFVLDEVTILGRPSASPADPPATAPVSHEKNTPASGR